MSEDIYDAIIIGAGISGLVCGCYLAKAGMKVLIVEQHDKPGGYFSSFKKKGFLFDAAAHSFGNYREGGHVRRILTEIGVDKAVRIKRFNPSDIVVTPDFRITFWNDKKETIDNIISLFPQERNNIIALFNFISSANQFEFAKLKNKTFSDFLHSFLKDERLISSIAFPVFISGGLPPSLMGAFIGVKIFSEFIIDGGYYPEGGIQKLPDTLVSIFEQNNGKVLYNKLAKKILIKNNSVKGIEIDSNERYYSKYVISACDMIQTFKSFLGEKIIGRRISNKLKAMTPSLSFFILYVGIRKPLEGLSSKGTNIWYVPHFDLDKIYRNIKKCYFDKTGYLLRISPDEKTLLVSFLAPFKTKIFWRQHKKRIACDFFNKIKKLFSDCQKHIVFFDAATPVTLCRYTLNCRGAAFGWAKIPLQTFDRSMSRTTSINGLYLTGHWTSMSFGMPGACYSGLDTARRILRKEILSGNNFHIN